MTVLMFNNNNSEYFQLQIFGQKEPWFETGLSKEPGSGSKFSNFWKQILCVNFTIYSLRRSDTDTQEINIKREKECTLPNGEICDGNFRVVVPARWLHRLPESIPWNRFLASLKV
jgi:hypothetical protein